LLLDAQPEQASLVMHAVQRLVARYLLARTGLKARPHRAGGKALCR
jgi:hypothetical protein